MKKSNVQVGETYLARVSGQWVKVRITRESVYGGWDAVNLKTKHSVRIKTAARLRYAPLPKEVSPLTRMSEMAKAAHQVATEEKAFQGPLASEKIQ